RGLAQAGRAEDEHVVQRLAPAPGCLDIDGQLLAHRCLAQVVGQPLRPDGGLDALVLAAALRGDQAVAHAVRRIPGWCRQGAPPARAGGRPRRGAVAVERWVTDMPVL